jgi:hypothetical protein
MINRLGLTAILFVFLFFCTGCLTADLKELRLSLKPDGKSGTGSIVFSKIHSEMSSDTANNTKADFNSLVTEYYQGKKIDESLKGTHNIKKRLYLDGNDLMGEVTFEFENIADLGFFQFNGTGPYMYYTLSDGVFTSGQFEASNGSYGGEKMPIIFWDSSARDFYVKISLASSQSPQRSITSLYKTWTAK